MKNSITAIILLLFSTTSLFAFQDFSEVEIEIVPVSDSVSMLKGAGGNIGILTGEDGVFMIDDQFAGLSEKIMNAISNLSNKPVKYLVNTHHHGDHTGGNENFQEHGAMILAHENVRKKLKSDTSRVSGLPVVTFSENLNLHINGNDIMVIHVDNAHTNGDALIYLPQSNVLHTGDTFFNGSFPFIDLNNGGSVDGDIAAAKTGLSIINKNTKIIPGHGNLATYDDYQQYAKMLEGIRSNVMKAIEEGKSEKEIINDENLTSEFITDEAASEAYINGPKIRTTFYNSLKK
ncbi:MBL fold metallo-hydrolase [Christiangramia sp. SM2212]|uniref:MBL fold metallo-hydrolase n=1 Tax=Christiangramia sediminicola TaxID=3073267 RepID=A0ABU1ESI4_9FLAO|nr:MBL fold metallo-hydrolase [Christiangramia sp. SM2212]MDR5590919.1 MBL fold metallo-hydrolase [Christiangramia sp. SM2212]